MNLTDLNAEIKERITEGTKPSDLKKTNPKTTSIPAAPPLPEEKKGKKEKESGSKKTNATVSSVVSFRVEQIEDSVKNLDKDLAVFGNGVYERLEKLENQLKTPTWKTILLIIYRSLILIVLAATAFFAFCVFMKP